MGWQSRLNNNPDKGKIKSRKPSKAQVVRNLRGLVLGALLNGLHDTKIK